MPYVGAHCISPLCQSQLRRKEMRADKSSASPRILCYGGSSMAIGTGQTLKFFIRASTDVIGTSSGCYLEEIWAASGVLRLWAQSCTASWHRADVTHGYFIFHNAPMKQEKRKGKKKKATKHSSKQMKGKNQTLTNWLVIQVKPSKGFWKSRCFNTNSKTQKERKKAPANVR